MSVKGTLTAAVLLAAAAIQANAQDDVTTRNGPSGYGGSFITGPASNPLSFLNGPAYRTFSSTARYLIPDSNPASLLDGQLPDWISFGWEERFRYEGYHNGSFKLNNDDSYSLLRSRLQMTIQPVYWFKLVSQVQDSRPFMQKPPWGPPNLNAWDLKLAYAEFGDPEASWIDLRVGRQLLNFNNTILANSEWRNQGPSALSKTDPHVLSKSDPGNLDLTRPRRPSGVMTTIDHHDARGPEETMQDLPPVVPAGSASR